MSLFLAPIAIGTILYAVLYTRTLSLIYWLGAAFVTIPTAVDAVIAVNDPVRETALLLCTAFNALYLLTQEISISLRRRRIGLASLDIAEPARQLALIGALGFALFLLSTPNLGRLAEMRWDQLASERQGWRLVLANFAQGVLLIGAGALAAPTIAHQGSRMRAALAVGSLLATAVLLRTKAYILPLILPPLFATITTRRKVFALKAAVKAVTILGLFVVLYQAITVVRWSGTFGNIGDAVTNTDLVQTVRANSVESSLNQSFYRVVDHFLTHDNLAGATYTRLLLYPIARITGYEPPENPIYYYNSIAGRGEAEFGRGSDHPTIYGDTYANFHFAGVLIAPLFALMTELWWGLSLRGRPARALATIGAFSFVMPLVVRGSVYYGLYAIVSALALFEVGSRVGRAAARVRVS